MAADAPAISTAPIHERRPWETATEAPYVRIENVVKRFGDFTAVKGVSIDIYKGEFFSLLGGSGCGKTTLLRMLAGFETPTSGRIMIDGTDVAEIPPHRRPVNMMFQSYALFPHMSVESNVGFGLRQEHRPKDEIAERVAAALKLVQMEKFARRKPHQLSGGQRQRIALARALVKRPKLLLLDEPLSALDKKLREETRFELVTIQEQVGITFIVVTHDQEEAMTMSTRIAVMRLGEIAQVGTPTEIYEAPSSAFVADFIGSVNLFDAVVTGRDGDGAWRLDSRDTGGQMLAYAQGEFAPGQHVKLGLRPEKIRIQPATEAAPAPNRAYGKVRDIAYLGDISQYVISLDSGGIARATQPNLSRRVDMPINWGQGVVLDWSPNAAVILPEWSARDIAACQAR